MSEEEKEIKKRLKEREEEDRIAVEQMLERERKEQQEIKQRLSEREREDRIAIEKMAEREQKEQQEIKQRLDEREREEKEDAIKLGETKQAELEKRLKEREEEDRIAVEQMLERERKEQQEIKQRLAEREKEERISIGQTLDSEPQEEVKTGEEIQQPTQIFASLRPIGSSEEKGVDTFSGTLPVYYVIIGRGPAAIINHTTLRQTEFGKKRINGLPVIHIGFANPWTKYMQHGMGQPPHLLNLPGFNNHPQHILKDEGLDSREFAGCIEAEYNRLAERYSSAKVITCETWVVWIQTKNCEPLGHNGVKIEDELKKDGIGDEFIGEIKKKLSEKFLCVTADLRLLVMNPKPGDKLKAEDIFFIYASHVDICTGPGRPNVIPPIGGDTEECKKARTAAWLSPETWVDQWGYELKRRKVLNGVEAIRDEIHWESGERVCVTAGGGVGLNAAERARNDNCKLDWFARTSLMDTFANPRNDTILRHPTENRILHPGESKVLNWTKDDQIIPCNKELRYGYGASLQSTGIFGSKVEVSLVGTEKSKIKDYFNKQVGFFSSAMWDCSHEYTTQCNQQPSKFYDRLVIPNGQASRALGHAYFFARHLTLTPLTATDGRMIGLKTVDEKVRVLGAAAQTYDQYGIGERNNKPEGTKMWLSWDSLPVSAVPDGMIFSGVNIAVANQFFDNTRLNKNVNTASQDELVQILTTTFGSSDAECIAKVIVEKRRRPDNNGYENILQVIDALRVDEEAKKISSLASITGLLDIAYTKSEDTDLLNDV